MVRVLVTGGAGFLGRNFIELVGHVHPDWDIRVVDRKPAAAWRSMWPEGVPQQVDYWCGDLVSEDLAFECVADTGVVVHFAAETHNDFSLECPRAFLDSNVVATYNLLHAARVHSTRFHYVSTDEVFGDLPAHLTAVSDEFSPIRASSPYSATKAAGEQLAWAWARSFGVPVTMSNGTNTYGPYQSPEKFIPRQIALVEEGKRAELYGQGSQSRSWIHVMDHCSAILLIAERGRAGQRYLVGGGTEISNRELVEKILQELGVPRSQWRLIADRPGHDQRYSVDDSKLRWELGWSPVHTNFSQELAGLVRWYRENEKWWGPLRSQTS